MTAEGVPPRTHSPAAPDAPLDPALAARARADDGTVLARPGRGFIWFLGGFMALVAGLVALPDQAYLRFQSLSETIHNRVQWSYERIHFDPTPIDIAVIGNSRMGAGINAPALSDALSARLGREINVVNLSTPQEGRNMHWVMARELLETRPEVSFILLSVIEQEPRVSHPAFASLGSRRDILTSPVLINRDWPADLAALPYRQLALFIQGLRPALFGLAADFDAGRYAGPDYDTTVTFTLPDGTVIDRSSAPPEAELRRVAEARVRQITRPLLPDTLSDYEFSVERSYTRRIAALAAERDVGLGFVYLPIYLNDGEIHNAVTYAALGPIFEGRQFVGTPEYFSDYGHLNNVGARAAVPWLADALVDAIDAGTLSLRVPTDQP